MKNKKKLITLILQIFLVIAFVFSYQRYVDFNLQPTEVFGYARKLDDGVKLTERDLIKIPLSQMTLTSSMIQIKEPNKIIGKYTTIPVIGRSIVYREQLGDISAVDKFASFDMSNAVVISLPIDYTLGVAGDFRRGDRVDIMYSVGGATTESSSMVTSGASGASSSASEGEDVTFSYAKFILYDIPVYQVNTATGHMFVPHSDKSMYNVAVDEAGNPIDSEQFESIASISLLLTHEQAEEIKARSETGNLSFAKRFEETETHETLGFVIGNYGKLFAGNANAETSNVRIADAFISPIVDPLPMDGNTATDALNSSLSGESKTDNGTGLSLQTGQTETN